MKEINVRFSFHPARNAEHYQAHSDLLAVATPEFATANSIAELRAAYAALIAVENDCYLRNAAYQDTPEVEAADKKRDDLFLYIAQTITTSMLCPYGNAAAAAKRLAFHLDPYRDAPRLNYASNTAAIADFVDKMGEEANITDLVTLDLTTAVDQLAAANRAFSALYNARSSELLTRSTGETMKTIRPQVDDAFRALASAVNALYQVNALVTKDPAKESELGTVIDRANAILVQLQKTLSRSGVGSKPSVAPENKPLPVEPGNGGGNPGGGGGGGGNPTPQGGGSGEGQEENPLG